VNYALHAGALWRDEVNSVSMATYPSLATTWARLQFDSFPMLWYVALRAWIRTGLGQTDGGLRVFGLLVNFAILGMLWLNAWRMSRRPPLVALTLLGANATVMIFCGSIRGYGLGVALGLWMYGALWEYIVQPSPLRWTTATLAAILACHMLYYNCTFVAAACIAAAAVAVARRQWLVAAGAMAVGAAAAATLLIYLPTFRSSGNWRSMYTYSGGFSAIWLKFLDAVRLDQPVKPLIWVIVLLIAPAAALLAWKRTRSDLALFAVTSLVVGVFGNIVFLRLLDYYAQPWYFICLMSVVAAAADAALGAAEAGKILRTPAIPIITLAVVSLSVYPLYLWSTTRLTDIDEIAHEVEQSATGGDYVVVGDWTNGITFHRYYHGSTPWQTLPALPEGEHDIHRSDLVFNAMHSPDAIGPVLDSVIRTLRGGHRVFYIGRLSDPLPSEPPQVFLSKRIRDHNPPAAVEVWRYEVAYVLHESARQMTRIPTQTKQPVSPWEDPELSVFDGGK
jgi:hypothetical protein